MVVCRRNKQLHAACWMDYILFGSCPNLTKLNASTPGDLELKNMILYKSHYLKMFSYQAIVITFAIIIPTSESLYGINETSNHYFLAPQLYFQS